MRFSFLASIGFREIFSANETSCKLFPLLPSRSARVVDDIVEFGTERGSHTAAARRNSNSNFIGNETAISDHVRHATMQYSYAYLIVGRYMFIRIVLKRDCFFII